MGDIIMSDLLKEAIADAKAVRETALANAKMALEEAFTPHLKSMLSAKLAEDDIEEDDNPFADKDEDEDEDMPEEGMHDSPRREDDDDEEDPEEGMHDSPRREDDDDEDEDEVDESEIVEIDGVKYAPIVSEEEHEDEDEDDEDDMDESEELDLEAVIKELEEELEESKEDEEDSVNEEEITEGPDDEEEKVDEEIDLNEEDEEDLEEQSSSSGIGKGTGVKQPSASDEEDPGKGKVHESVEAIQSELNEYKEAVSFLRDKLHEVNILNAKLLYTNKLFKEYALSNDQKLKIVETFDRAQTTREIKLVYSTLAESFTGEKTVKKDVVKEFASKKSGGTAPKTKIISEENQVADRFRKLAGIL
jgi:hypothetical protein